MKVTLDIDDTLYRAVKVEAARSDRSVRDIAHEALTAWLEAAEEAEDRASAEAALTEYRRDGGAAAEAWFARVAAEAKATYGTEGAFTADASPTTDAGPGPDAAPGTATDPDR